MNAWLFIELAVLIVWAAFCFSVGLVVALQSWTNYREQKAAIARAFGQ